MGMWTLVVEGCGAHHNRDFAGDADVLAAEFVEMLKRHGQIVSHVSFTHSGREDLKKAPRLGEIDPMDPA